jgi:uncharacterized Tic20 family protein
MFDTTQRKILSALSHGAIFFSTGFVFIGIPIAILLVSNDPVVKENAKESINFHFNVWLYGIICAFIFGILALITFGLLIPLLWLVLGLGFLLHWGLTVAAIMGVLTNPETPFRYPFIFRLF